MSVIFLVGTSRANGNTWSLLNHVNQKHSAPVISLADKNISYFDYESRNVGDDFIPTVEELIKYDIIGIVSPVYWYTVSAQMKTFMDRLSDLLGPRKDLGRLLRGKNTFLLANGNTEEKLPPGMDETIKLTSDYLGMNYRGSFYARFTDDLKIEPVILSQAQTFVDAMFEL